MRPSGGATRGSGDAPALEVAAEIDEQQPVVAALAEEAQHERLRAEHRAVEPTLTRPGEGRVLAPQAQEVAVERDRVAVALGFAPVELAALEAVAGLRIGEPPPASPAPRRSGTGAGTRAGRRERAAPAPACGRRSRGTASTPRTPGPGTASASRAPAGRSAVSARDAAGARQLVQPRAARRVRDLVVVLEEGDEARRRQVEAGRAAALASARRSAGPGTG